MIKGFFLTFTLFVILIFNFNVNVNSYDYQDGIKIYEEQIKKLENQRDTSIKNLESIYDDSIKRAEQRVLEAKQAYNNMYDIADRQANMAVSRGSNGLILDEGTKQALYNDVMKTYKDTLDRYKYTVQQAEYNLKIIKNEINSELAPKILQIRNDYEIKIQNKEKLIMELIKQEEELINKREKVEEMNKQIEQKTINTNIKESNNIKIISSNKYVPTLKDLELIKKVKLLIKKLSYESPNKIALLSKKIKNIILKTKEGTQKHYLLLRINDILNINLLYISNNITEDEFNKLKNNAITYSFNNQYNKSIEEWTKIIEIDPEYIIYQGSYMQRGLKYIKIFEYDKALKDLEKDEILRGATNYIYNAKGKIYFAKKEYERAIIMYKKAIDLSPDNVYIYIGNVYNNIGLTYSKLNNLSKACENRKNGMFLKSNAAKANYGINICEKY